MQMRYKKDSTGRNSKDKKNLQSSDNMLKLKLALG